MDKLTRYRTLINEILQRHLAPRPAAQIPEIERLLIADDERGHYMWLNLGWAAHKRCNTPTVYVRLHNDKFWIETDFTEEGIANELMAAGVPKEDIVLAFHAPDMRPYTDFAVA